MRLLLSALVVAVTPTLFAQADDAWLQWPEKTALEVGRLMRVTGRVATRLLHEAEAAADTIVMVELDPREGSGVIPLDWAAYLQPKGAAPDAGRAVAGTLLKSARDNPALAGVEKRDYDFDVFVLGFPLHDSDRRFVLTGATEAELVIRINSSEGRVSWPVPESIHRRAEQRRN